MTDPTAKALRNAKYARRREDFIFLHGDFEIRRIRLEWIQLLPSPWRFLGALGALAVSLGQFEIFTQTDQSRNSNHEEHEEEEGFLLAFGMARGSGLSS